MVPLRRGTIPVPTSPKTVPHFTHLGHDLHERLVAFCHDGRGIALSRRPPQLGGLFQAVTIMAVGHIGHFRAGPGYSLSNRCRCGYDKIPPIFSDDFQACQIAMMK
jgi:hypothetical protein